MKNKFYFIFLITFQLFSQENNILWDLGVIIEAPKKKLNETPNGRALISNSFISPTYKSNKKTTTTFENIYHNQFPKNDIKQIKTIITKLTIKELYQPIIDLIRELNLDDFQANELHEINYWLANAFLNTGQYEMAENILLNNSQNENDDKSNFLLATIFEHQNKRKKAQKEYLNFIKKYPNSDYKMSALIKARMLD
ncbi:MAG: tetratricopeptide repeat protein [Candidatus Neomarinimicrobiota bacterium]|nr:tetratricopeptide repeat protein [Candidatus Neomarinimicrobiota bacterium]